MTANVAVAGPGTEPVSVMLVSMSMLVMSVMSVSVSVSVSVSMTATATATVTAQQDKSPFRRQQRLPSSSPSTLRRPLREGTGRRSREPGGKISRGRVVPNFIVIFPGAM